MRFYTLLILLVLGCLSVGYGQQLPDFPLISGKTDVSLSVQPLAQTPKIPSGFPEWVKTGDYEKDKANFEAAKKVWLETHIEEYIAVQPGLSEEGKEILRKQYTSKVQQETSSLVNKPKKDNSQKIQKIAYEDFILMNDEERERIEQSPELFQIVKRSEIQNK